MSDEPPRPALRIEIAPRTLLWILLAIACAWIAVKLWSVFVVLLVALVLVGTFDPLVAWLQRRGLGRGRALAVIFLVVALAFAAILTLTIPPLLAQLQHIIDDAPSERYKLIDFLSQYRWANPFVKTIRAVPLEDLWPKLTTVVGFSGELLTGVGYVVTTIFLALYLLADPSRAQAGLYVLVPRHHHVKLARILLGLKEIVGGYMRGQLITSVAITIFTLVLLSLLKVPDALALAVFAGLTDVIPFIGGYLASAPAILSVATRGGPTILVVAVAMVLYQEFESRILVPRVYGRVLRLSPAIVLVALLIGGTLLGILGALLALPVAAGVQLIVRELRVELPGGSPTTESTRARDDKAEQIYERLSANESVQDSVAIAGKLAETVKAGEESDTRISQELAAIEKKPPSDE